eukprot:184642_1
MVRVFVLFYQSINYILWINGYTFWGTFIIQILALDSYIWLSFFNYSPQGTCFINNLTAIQYHFLYLYFPACLMLALIIYAIFKKTCCKTQNSQFQFGGYTIVNVALIALFPIFIVFFMLLSCKYIDGFGTIHFYASYMKCYEISWFVALIVLLMVIVFLTYICVILKQMVPNRNNLWKQKSYFLKGIVQPYKFDFWYWEYILILRRICIILF